MYSEKTSKGQMLPRPVDRICALFTLVIAMACSNDRHNGPSGAEHRDSAGINIVENQGHGKGLPFTVSVQPSVRIGAVDPVDSTTMFIQVEDAVRLSDGRIVVLERVSGEVRWFSGSGRHLITRAGRGRGLGRYWVITYSEVPQIFDHSGQFIKSVGGRGEGPGEFLGVLDAIPVADDSMLIIDNALRRATVVSSDLKPGRTIAIGSNIFRGTALAWPNRTVANALMYGSASIGWPLHLISFEATIASTMKSFGPGSGEYRPGDPTYLFNPLTSVSAGSFWSAETLRYRLHRWSTDGMPLMSLERAPEWFSVQSAGGVGNPAKPPPPRVRALEVDTDGLVWVFVSVPARAWRAAWPSGMPSAVSEIPLNKLRTDLLFDTMIEVIDPGTRRLVASMYYEGNIMAALPNGSAAMYEVSRDGVPRIVILRMFVEGR
jgi:hypothetical protein